MPWINSDGLRVKFGPEETEKARVTEIATNDNSRTIEIVVSAETLPAVADNSVIIDDSYIIYEGAVFESIRVVKSIDFAGTGTLDIGVIAADGGAEITDPNGLVEAITVAELNAGGEDVAGWVGVLLTDTTILAEKAFLTWEVNTAAITAGSASIYISYQIPKLQGGDSLVWDKAVED